MRLLLLVSWTATQALVPGSFCQRQSHQQRPLCRRRATEELPEETTGNSSALQPMVPLVITFEPVNTILRRSVPVGLLYRDTLLRWTGLMLPRPDIFERAYDDAVQRAEAESPRFGAMGAGEDDWWRAVARDVYGQILVPGTYDEEELAIYEKQFDNIYRELHDSIEISEEAWERGPHVKRVLGALKDWKMDNGPAIGICSTEFDSRLGATLDTILGEDLMSTFDFLCANSYENDAFDMVNHAYSEMKSSEINGRWIHVLADDARPSETLTQAQEKHGFKTVELSSAKSDLYTGTSYLNLLELIELWNLPSIPEDDLFQTTRTYSVYDQDFYDDVPPDLSPIPQPPKQEEN